LNVKGIAISQIAIKLPARTYGHSKMRFKDVVRSVLLLLQLGWRSRLGRTSPLHAAQSAGPDGGENARADFKSVPAP
jgi:hypothetical protein